MKVWDATSGQETLTLTGHTAPARSLTFSPHGKRLASAGEDRTVKVWDATGLWGAPPPAHFPATEKE